MSDNSTYPITNAADQRLIPDVECAQSKCACTTTGCWGECSLKRNPVVFVMNAASSTITVDVTQALINNGFSATVGQGSAQLGDSDKRCTNPRCLLRAEIGSDWCCNCQPEDQGSATSGDVHVDCRSESGITSGLIDGIIAMARVLRERDQSDLCVVEALKDIRQDEDVAALLGAALAAKAEQSNTPSNEPVGHVRDHFAGTPKAYRTVIWADRTFAMDVPDGAPLFAAPVAERAAAPVGQGSAVDALLNIRDCAYFDASPQGDAYYRKAENALAVIECRDAKAKPVRVQGSATSGEEFRKHLDKCSAEVATWPAWKRLGGFDQGSATSGEAALIAELDWCIEEGNVGPRSKKALIEARAALAAKAEQSNTSVPRVGGNTSVEDILKIVAENTDKRINLSNGDLDIYIAVVRAALTRFAAPASVPKPAALEVAEQALQALRHMQGLAALPDGRNPRDVLLTYIQLTSDAAPEVSQPAAQGESIDMPEFRKLSYAYAEALMHGTIPQTSAAWEALVDFCNAWGASQRQEGRREADLEARNSVAAAIGLPTNGLRDGKPVSLAWSYLLGIIKDLATA